MERRGIGLDLQFEQKLLHFWLLVQQCTLQIHLDLLWGQGILQKSHLFTNQTTQIALHVSDSLKKKQLVGECHFISLHSIPA